VTTREKKSKFKRLAARRTNVLLDKLRLLGNCANRNLYGYTNAQVTRIFKAIEDEIAKTKKQFVNPGKEFMWEEGK